MRKEPGRTLLAATSILCSFILAACNCAPTLRYVSVAPASPTILATAVTSGGTTTVTPCTTQQFAATAYYSDGSQKDISSVAGWGSSNTSVAAINATGLASAASTVPATGGTSVITATSGGASGTATLTVDVLTSIAVTPAATSVALGATQQYAATGTLTVPGGSTTTMDLTTQVTWSVAGGTTSSDGSTNSNANASIGTATGLLTTTSQNTEGTTTVTATLCNITGSTTVTIGAPATQLLQIFPDSPSIAVGQTVDLNARIINTDGSTTFPVPTAVTWASATGAVASAVGNAASPYDALVTGLTAGTSVITATVGSGTTMLTGTTTVTVSAAVARFAYVANVTDSSISGYAPHAANGAFTPIGKVSSLAGQVVPHPSGMFVYSVNIDGSITVFNVNSVSGALTPSTTAPIIPSLGSGPVFATVDPSGQWLYAIDATAGKVFAFSISQGNGALTPIGSGLATGATPIDVLVTPNDKFVYVINSTATGSVSAYSIGATGALTSITGPTTVLNLPQFAAIDPTSAYLFVPDAGDNTIVPFTIGSDGTLTAGTAFAFTPALSPTTDSLGAVAVDPTSKFLYVVDDTNSGGTATAGNLYALSIGSGGALTATINSGKPYTLGIFPTGIAVDPSGKIVAVANNADNTISVFTAAADGSLTADNLVEASGAPSFMVFASGTAEATSSVSAVVAANITNSPTTGTLSAYTVDSTGVLTAVGTPFASLPGNSKVANFVFGTSVFTTSHSASDLGGYTVDTTATPPFSQIAAPVVLPGAGGSLVADTTGNFVYAADTTTNKVAAYSATTLAATGSATPAISAGILALVSDPQGALIYALGTNSITALLANAAGTISVGPVLSVTGTWSAGAISPDGRFLVAVDSATNKLQVFSISPLGGGSDGTLTAVGSEVAIPGAMTVSAVAFDPLGRGFVVTDYTATTNNVTPFTISAGAVTAGTAVTTPTGATSAVIDPTGGFLFVGVFGNPTASTPVPGGVQVYTISSTFGLTAVGTPVNADLATWGVGILNTVQ
jgi:6-phosphogluconolactonase (cycloisomerase 2 family)